MKKFLSIILASLIIFSTLSVAASAAGDSLSAATSISLNKTYSGTISNSSTKDFYSFSLSSSGRLRIKFSSSIYRLNMYIYDSDGDNIWSSGTVYCDSNTEEISYDKTVDLTAGKYYFSVVKNAYNGDYSFKLSTTSAGESFSESNGGNNNIMGSADSISLNKTYYGQIATNDIKDFYKFSVSSGTVSIKFSSDIYRLNLYIYNSNGSQEWSSSTIYCNSSTGEISYNKDISLSSGTYYLAVVMNSYTGNYNFKLSGSSSSSGSSTVNLSLSDTSVSVAKGSSTKVTCSYSGSNSNGVKISYSIGNKEIVSCSWGDWSNKKIPITISGLEEGSTTVKISLKDSSTNEVLDSETISVTVSPEGSGNSTGGGTSSGGFSIFTLIFYFFALILSIFF